MEFVLQFQRWWLTGEWTHFLIFAIYAWAVMSPRSLGAGVTKCFEENYVFQITRGYLVAVAFGLGQCWLAFYAWQQGWTPDDWGPLLIVFSAFLLVLIVLPVWGRAVVRFLFSLTPGDELGRHHRSLRIELVLSRWQIVCAWKG